MPRSNAGYYIMQGAQGLGRGIRDAGAAAGSVMADNKQRREKDKESKEMMDGFKMFYQNSPELQEMMPVEDFDDLSPNMVRGMTQAMTAKAAMMDKLFQPHYKDAETVGGEPGEKIWMQSPNSGYPVQGRRSVDPGTGPQMSEDGRFYMDPNRGEWKPVPSGSGYNAGPKVSAYELKKYTIRREEIIDELDTLQKELENGNKKSGPDWGWGTKYEDRMRTLERELSGIDAVLQGGQEAEAPAPAAGQNDEEYLNQRREQMARQLNSRKGNYEMDMMDRTPEINNRMRRESGGNANKPRIGQNVKGYIFLGGNPADQNNWDKE